MKFLPIGIFAFAYFFKKNLKKTLPLLLSLFLANLVDKSNRIARLGAPKGRMVQGVIALQIRYFWGKLKYYRMICKKKKQFVPKCPSLLYASVPINRRSDVSSR